LGPPGLRPPQLSKEVGMSTQHHPHEQQEDSGLTTMLWLGGALVVLAVIGYFFFM
jgi:hypothetical protein